eukprot:Gb_14619 [translate_table: standard]
MFMRHSSNHIAFGVKRLNDLENSTACRFVRSSMATTANAPRFAYTVVYVKDVAKSAEFYSKAFGFNIRRLDHSRRWGELESGSTTIAFTPLEQHETDITGGVQTAAKNEPRHNVEICFTYKDVDSAFKHAVEKGALPVAAPEAKEWGQKVGYVRDTDGVMIRMGSLIVEPY